MFFMDSVFSLLQYKVLYFIFVSFKYIYFVTFILGTNFARWIELEKSNKIEVSEYAWNDMERPKKKYMMRTEREMRCDLTTPKRKPNHDDIDTMDVWELFSAFVVVRCGLHFYFNFFVGLNFFWMGWDFVSNWWCYSEDWVCGGGCQ